MGVVVAGDEGVVEVCDGDVLELEGCDVFVASTGGRPAGSLGTDASVRGSHCSCIAAAAVVIALAHAFLCADRTHWGAAWAGTHFPSRALPARPMAADNWDDAPRRVRALEMSDDEAHFVTPNVVCAHTIYLHEDENWTYMCGDESNISKGMHIKTSGSARDLMTLTHSSNFPILPHFPRVFPLFFPGFPRFSPIFPVFPPSVSVFPRFSPVFPVFPPSVSFNLCHRLSSL